MCGAVWAPDFEKHARYAQQRKRQHYERDEKGIPVHWVERMRRSISTTMWQFSTTRMLHEYTERLYLPAAGVEVASEAADATNAAAGEEAAGEAAGEVEVPQ